MAFSHHTVLLHEAVRLLKPEPGKLILDGTLGGGGHSEALLQAGADVVGLDRDHAALDAAAQRLKAYGTHFQAREGNFADAASLPMAPFDGVLLDLGVSSHQLDTPGRGFSFQADGPLDMRLGQDGVTAAELIASLEEKELADVIWRYGDERFSRPIARALKATSPQTTQAAAFAIAGAVPKSQWPKRVHVATKTFQALRIAVNGELDALDQFLDKLPSLLKPGGVAAIIAFHSLEDRRVKTAFRRLTGTEPGGPAHVPPLATKLPDFELLTRKSISAGEDEVEDNPRARSAHLRAVEKIR